MGKKRSSGPSAAALPAQGTKISFGDDDVAPIPVKALPKAAPKAPVDSDDDSDDDDDAPEAVGMSSGRVAEEARLAAADE
jgi:hypothetical protein